MQKRDDNFFPPTWDQKNMTQIIESITFPVLVIDKAFKVLFFNKTAANYYGYPKEKGIKYFEFTRGREKSCEKKCLLKKVFARGEPVISEEIHRMHSGKEVDMEIHAMPIFNAQGEVNMVLEVGIDISDRKEAERKLNRQLEFNSTLNDLGQQLLYSVPFKEVAAKILRKSCQVTCSSRGFVGYINENKEIVIPLSFANNKIFQEETKLNKDSSFFTIMDKGKPVVINDLLRQSSDQKWTSAFSDWENLIGVPVLIEDKIMGIIVLGNTRGKYGEKEIEFLHQIASLWAVALQRQKNFSELEKANSRLKNIINSLPDGTFVVDENRQVIAWNKVLEEMTGTKEQDILHKGNYAYAIPFYQKKKPVLLDFIFEEELKNSKGYSKLDKKDQTFFGEGYVPALYNGQGAYLWGAASPIFDNKGKVIGAVESVRDVTHRRMVEKSLRFIAKETSAELGEDFFETLVQYVSKVLDADYAFMGVLTEDKKIEVKAIWCENRGYLDKFSYDFENTPCEKAIKNENGKPIFYPENVAQLFPDDKFLFTEGIEGYRSIALRDREGNNQGILGVLSKRPMRVIPDVDSILKIFRDRASAELERQKIEKELRRNEAFTRASLNSMEANIAVLDKQGNVIMVNESWRDFALKNGGSFSLGQGKGWNYFEVCEKASGEEGQIAKEVAQGINEVLKGEKDSFAKEYSCYTKNRKEWFLVNVTPLRYGGGGVVTTHVDITERKKFENRQQAELAVLSELNDYNNLEMGLKNTLNILATVTGCEKGVLRLYQEGDLRVYAQRGFSGERVEKTPFCDLYREKELKQGDSLCRMVFYKNFPFEVQEKNITNFGSLVIPKLEDLNGILSSIPCRKCRGYNFSSLALVPIKDENNRNFGILQIMSNRKNGLNKEILPFLELISRHIASAIKHQEDALALQESEARYRRLAENAPDVIYRYYFSSGGYFEYINPALKDMLGYVPREFYENKKFFFDVIHPKDRGKIETILKGTAYEGKTVELRLLRNDGKIIWTEHRIIYLRNKTGAIQGIEGVARDITRQKENLESLQRMSDQLAKRQEEIENKNRELKRANKLKSEFLANMSHELRTPLNSIIGFSDLLEKEIFGDLTKRQKEYVEDIRQSGEHLLELINDILDLSKIEAGMLELDLQEVDLPSLIQTGIRMFREKAHKNNLTLQLDIESDLGIVICDPRKLKQVLFNLISNAMKFTSAGGKITVGALRENGWVKIWVEDTGIGIPSREKDRLFEEFYQVDGSLSRQHEGTGLGLALSKKIVELHGGNIDVISQIDQGSTFYFTLPLKGPKSF